MLATIPLEALISNEQKAVERLVEAASNDGCFYLDISSAKILFDAADQISVAADSFFNLPVHEKLLYEMDHFTNLHMGGYKTLGKHSGVKQGKRDAFENFLVPLNALVGLQENLLAWPAAIENKLDLLCWFEIECHRVCQLILERLSSVLGAQDVPFQQNHRLDEMSTTSLALLKYPPSSALEGGNAGHMAHTDVGSLTLLFTKTPGLDIWRESTACWAPALPQSGCIIVNVGDALSFMSKRRFKSCLHRVVPITASTRFSLAFFHRPELGAKFHDGEGREWTGESWHRAKYQLFRADNRVQASNALLTGKINFLGHIDEHGRTQVTA
ncbi:uncharacterized protein MYCFIDRAFT_165730 [Pseudocercospora fijiensis CIRAD86]|uniref:Fe2OG dioxygenase domain-containing protein n=1 Tax=Pseudocercospora fijiensis (strain CIRAD86) TaxID=383855 RepID=M2ZP45_PSEFD|nr:uncharacterized protein MYCFIDRAFT_165730 [Pseudocercospora fijiensis CIRAD86]EME80879.1 hypothetical protein MYCFIDRAFT_165730 [Pseudocercospora fijiensis CIRAD86]